MSENDKQLLRACRILFGSEVVISQDFLCYLRKEGVTSAFRKRAKVIHPDRRLINGHLEENESFTLLCNSRDRLLAYIQQRHIQQRENDFQGQRNGQNFVYSDIIQQPNAQKNRLLFGHFLYNSGVISWGDLIKAVTWQRMSRPRIGELGVLQGHLSREIIGTILNNSTTESPFGATAITLGLLTQEEVQQLLLRQKTLQKKIGQYFVESELLSNEQIWSYLRRWRVQKARSESP